MPQHFSWGWHSPMCWRTSCRICRGIVNKNYVCACSSDSGYPKWCRVGYCHRGYSAGLSCRVLNCPCCSWCWILGSFCTFRDWNWFQGWWIPCFASSTYLLVCPVGSPCFHVSLEFPRWMSTDYICYHCSWWSCSQCRRGECVWWFLNANCSRHRVWRASRPQMVENPADAAPHILMGECSTLLICLEGRVTGCCRCSCN